MYSAIRAVCPSVVPYPIMILVMSLHFCISKSSVPSAYAPDAGAKVPRVAPEGLADTLTTDPGVTIPPPDQMRKRRSNDTVDLCPALLGQRGFERRSRRWPVETG